MADLELTSASLATREAIADLLPIPSAYGKLYYSGSQSLSVTTAGVQVVGWTKGTDDNLVLNDNDIEILYQGRYKIFAMVSFTDGNNIAFDLEIRKNGTNLCVCNPQLEVVSGRESFISSFEVADLVAGDKISVYLKSDSNTTATMLKQKLIVTN
ncbi:MAG: hypothetical protein EBR93_01280 [Bacteroidetes bacterium]|nr:hypothetical protein [Bacteroidota bacterium]